MKEASKVPAMPDRGDTQEGYQNRAEEAVQKQMRYAHKRTPEERWQDKMGHFEVLRMSLPSLVWKM